MEKKEKKGSFAKKFRNFVLTILFLAAAVYVLQRYYNLFDAPLKYVNQYLPIAREMFFKQMLTGVSVGTVLFIVILLIFPMLSKNIDTRSYFTNLRNGIVSAFTFYISQITYSYFEKINKNYLYLSMFVASLITIVLVLIVAKMFKSEKKSVAFRTENIASVTAGLIFSVLLKLIMVGIDWTKFTDLSKIKLH
jgi:hypothetical protein